MKRPSRAAATVLVVLSLAWMGVSAQPSSRPPAPASRQQASAKIDPAALPSPDRLAALRAYIKKTWTTLTRTIADLPAAAVDPKFPQPEGRPWPVYVASDEELVRVRAELATVLNDQQRRRIELRVLPGDTREGRRWAGTDAPVEAQRAVDTVAPSGRRRLNDVAAGPAAITDHGLLYVPQPYVVPGGRFNEMYGWDSYFILLGLLRDGEIELARDMVDNFVYEVEQYGTVLNANRTYFLTRSQPPFLTRMILGVFEKTGERDWLRRTWPAVQKFHRYWVTGEHLAGDTGLSRYFDFGEGPAPEVVSAERDAQGRSHYDRVKTFYRTTRVTDYDVSQYYDRNADALTPLFYKGDRSMRESGFDPSNRFGPFNVDVIHYAPVCLNSLLYQMERDLAEIATLLGDAAEARSWSERAGARQERINRLLWDERAGLYLDYDFRSGTRRQYPFATTFFPLWTGAATPETARRVRDRLARFEAPGGVLTSTTRSGAQWDAPFGWAPLQLAAVAGLRRYGYGDDADRLSRRFIALVDKEFVERGVIVEKYDVERRESDVAARLRFGYSSNEAGFGWTNGVVLELLAGLRRQYPEP